MAGALRPVVLLMVLASALFVADGVSDGVLPDTSAWIGGSLYQGFGVTSYLFAVANLLVALLIARGSERTLVARIGLSAFFLVERPLTAFLLGPKPSLSIGLHAAAAIVELVILLEALRVWRLGHSSSAAELTVVFSITSPIGARPGSSSPALAPEAREPCPIGAAASWLVGILTLLLSAVLVADGAYAGFVPGGRAWGLTGDGTGWLVYLFAIVALTISVRAVHGAPLALRLLFALALIIFVERAFSPFVQRSADTVTLALHVFAAFSALALALGTASALRSGGARARSASPETA